MSAREIVAAVAAVLRRGVRRLALAPAQPRAQGELGILLALALGVYASGVLSALPDPKKVIEDIAEALGAWTYVLVGVLAFLETGAFVGLVAPGRDGGDRRRRDRRPGRDRAAAADRPGLDLRRARRHHELLHRPPPRAAASSSATARG